jgi:hypothetical protein
MAAIEPGNEPAEGEEHTEFASAREAAAYAREHNSLPDYVEDPAEPLVEPAAPAVDTDNFDDIVPPEGEPEVVAPAASPVAAPAADPYAEFGGRQAVEDGVTIARALTTADGVRAIAAQSLQAMGYTPEQVTAFLQSPDGRAQVDAAVTPADPWAEIGDEDVVDGATVKQMLRTAVDEIKNTITSTQAEATRPLQEQIQQDRARVAKQAVDSTLADVLTLPANPAEITDVQRSQVQDVLAFAGRYIEAGNWDPNHVANAVRRGAADMQARDQARFQAYIKDKRAAKAAQPANIGGGSPAGGADVEEPKSAKEAAAMRKALGLFQ